jgi:hypothetical protein
MSQTISLAYELPEGITLDLSAYKASHGTPLAECYGRWGFGPGTAAAPIGFTGEPHTAAMWYSGTLTEAIDQLAGHVADHDGAPAEWHLLP